MPIKCSVVTWLRSLLHLGLVTGTERDAIWVRTDMNGCVCVSRSVVSDPFVTLWTVDRQAPLSMGFSSKNTGVGCHSLLQGIFLTQGLNPSLLYCRQIPSCLSPQHLPKAATFQKRIWPACSQPANRQPNSSPTLNFPARPLIGQTQCKARGPRSLRM